MSEIIGDCSGDLNIKRMYLPGLTIKSNCPKCGREESKDFSRDYLADAKVGSPTPVYFFCDDCTDDWQVQVQISITLEVISEAT